MKWAARILFVLVLVSAYLLYDANRNLICALAANKILAHMAALDVTGFNVDSDDNLIATTDGGELIYPGWCSD